MGAQQQLAVWLVIGLALVAANLPFLSQRVLLVFRSPWPQKPFALRLAELLVFFFLTGAVAMALERWVGQVQPQGWEFYAVAGALFLTFAFPGFVFRYLLKRPGHATAADDD
ncbi:MAG: DUF2818 family protein [Burkholderiaceae bacterium]|jgi:hypothetical protein|nr:DUF2818 family protein [Burkholderiaceae bacterium]